MKTANLKLTLIAASAALMLVACNRNDAGSDKTAGQKLDTAIAKVEQKTEEAKTEIRQDMAAAKESVSNAADKVATKTEDAAITAGVNAELAKDPALSALRIDVDTSNGNVRLSGVAPSPMARDRASRLAAAVKGVNSVDNRLEVRG